MQYHESHMIQSRTLLKETTQKTMLSTIKKWFRKKPSVNSQSPMRGWGRDTTYTDTPHRARITSPMYKGYHYLGGSWYTPDNILITNMNLIDDLTDLLYDSSNYTTALYHDSSLSDVGIYSDFQMPIIDSNAVVESSNTGFDIGQQNFQDNSGDINVGFSGYFDPPSSVDSGSSSFDSGSSSSDF